MLDMGSQDSKVEILTKMTNIKVAFKGPKNVLYKQETDSYTPTVKKLIITCTLSLCHLYTHTHWQLPLICVISRLDNQLCSVTDTLSSQQDHQHL